MSRRANFEDAMIAHADMKAKETLSASAPTAIVAVYDCEKVLRDRRFLLCENLIDHAMDAMDAIYADSDWDEIERRIGALLRYATKEENPAIAALTDTPRFYDPGTREFLSGFVKRLNRLDHSVLMPELTELVMRTRAHLRTKIRLSPQPPQHGGG